jgi:hypothetical protein
MRAYCIVWVSMVLLVGTLATRAYSNVMPQCYALAAETFQSRFPGEKDLRSITCFDQYRPAAKYCVLQPQLDKPGTYLVRMKKTTTEEGSEECSEPVFLPQDLR